jgi:hypothetical protein
LGMEGGWEREILRGNMIKKLIVLLIAVSFTKAAYCQVSVHRSKVVNCAQATRTRPQIGNAFRGSVSNVDYAFSARIPNGLTGWGGVYKDAPFHGFAIFLDSNMEACIVFEVHLRVDSDDTARPPSGATPIQLGKAQGWQWIRESRAANFHLTNIHLLFSFRQPNQMDDGEVLLITPTSRLKEAKTTYDALVRSIKFGRVMK